jgi:hypothetical protein
MPSTFELLVLSPEEVELLSVKEQPQKKGVWTKRGDEWVAE